MFSFSVFIISNITINTIKLNGVVPAKTQPINISGYDYDGIPDLMVELGKSAVAQFNARTGIWSMFGTIFQFSYLLKY